MRPSIVIKKLMRVVALGITLIVTFGTVGFFCYMGWLFGYQDLQCKQFPETRKFASELVRTLYSLENDVEYLESYNNEHFLNDSIRMAKFRYKDSILEYTETGSMSLQYFLNSSEVGYYTNEYGVTEIYSDDSVEYNDSWYKITLNEEVVKDTDAFCTISREDYINLVLENAVQNTRIVDNVTDEVSEEKLEVYINEDFSANSYIGYYDDLMYVYSPEEDMFYSNLYGWYTIPDTLYFRTEDVQSCNGIDLLYYQFTSKKEILRQKVGEDYLEYIRASKNLNYNQRNIGFYVVSGNHLYTNVGSLDKLVSCNLYLCIEPTASGEYTVEFQNFKNVYLNDEFITGIMQNIDVLEPDENGKLYIGIYTTYPYYDVFSEGNQMFTNYYPYTIPAVIIGVIMGIISLILCIRIFRTCGRVSKEDRTIHLSIIDKVPVEVMAAIGIIGIVVLAMGIYKDICYNLYNFHYFDIADFIEIFTASYFFIMLSILSIVRRGKAKKIFDKSIIRWIFILLKKIIYFISRQKNLSARTVELFILYWLFMLSGGTLCVLSVEGGGEVAAVMGGTIILAVNIVAFVLMLRQAKGEQSIRDATRALAEGDLEYQFPSMKRLGTEQEIIDNINHLSDGLQKAVEKSIYDEKMKAELITNVSHDIKTPLTSIINYVDLIKRENIENEKVLHYIEVLDRKSQRLKQLTEDLVEVSKITTGNIELERVPIDLGELLRQSIGEFEDKFAERELQVMDNIQEHSYMIFADGRRTFRILENLFQNIYKYAMPKTRVYIDLNNENQRILLSIKNISMAPLNIDTKELMERFVRGDQSRTTEGSGLGLSIAQDLVKLQDGEFEIYLDGDLFKVVIIFPEFTSNEIIDMEAPINALENGTTVALEKKKN